MQEILGFNVVIKMKNVFEFLEQHAALALLEEPDIELATQEILYDGSKTREELEEVCFSRFVPAILFHFICCL